MSLDERVSRFIGRIYEGAYDAAEWDAVLCDLVDLTHAHRIFVSLVDTEHAEYSSARFYGREVPDPDVIGIEYAYETAHLDPSLKFAAANPHARFCSTADLLPRSHYLDDPFIRWNASRIGSTHWLVGYTPPQDGLTLGISLHPHQSVGPPRPEDEHLFRMLFDHLERALKLAARPASIHGADALVLLDRRGRVAQTSEAARKKLSEGDGMMIHDGQLRAAHPDDRAALDAAIASALNALSTGGCGGALRLRRPSGRRELLVTARPIPRGLEPGAAFGPAAIVKIVDPADRPAEDGLIRQLFGLTQREGEAACLLLAGHSPESLAATMNISVETARVHLRALFHKTGTNRQSELVRILSESA